MEIIRNHIISITMEWFWWNSWKSSHFYWKTQRVRNAISTFQNIRFSNWKTWYSEKWKSRSENVVFPMEMIWFPWIPLKSYDFYCKHHVFTTRSSLFTTSSIPLGLLCIMRIEITCWTHYFSQWRLYDLSWVSLKIISILLYNTISSERDFHFP